MGKQRTFKKTFAMLESSTSLQKSIADLMDKESMYAPVSALCKSYEEKIKSGVPEDALCESFVEELSKAGGHQSSLNTVATLKKAASEHGSDVAIAKAVSAMRSGSDAYMVPMFESALVEYMIDKGKGTRDAARESLSLFEGDANVKSILDTLAYDEHEEKAGRPSANSKLLESALPKERTYTQEEVGRILEDERAKAAAAKEADAAKEISSYDTKLNLHGAIRDIMVKESRNEGLKAFCETYMKALNEGRAEETLYESFISGISRWNYLNAVDTQISALNDRIGKYKQDIDLKKILKTMESTSSYYIVPLIEGLVVDYMEDKSMQKKAVLKQRLEAFEYDPFVRDILNVVINDQSIESNVYLGESVEKLNGYVHAEKVYSPLRYVKENECVFNVKGTYYVRKGNSVTKLSKNSVANLDESFRTLCNVLNHPAVRVNDLTNTISVYEGLNKAEISESEIAIDGTKTTGKELASLVEMAHRMGDPKEGFYKAVKMLDENFNKIAYVDFVKRIALNESNGKTVDVFKIKKDIFVTTADESAGTSTFYRNVNPMQCRSIINEHMGLNVAPLFEDVLPNQGEIQKDIDETKKQYEDYISELEEKKSQLEKMRDEAGDDTLDSVKSALEIVGKELDDTKSDYKAYQENVDGYVGAASGSGETESADDAAKAVENQEEMEEPITQDASAETQIGQVGADGDDAAVDAVSPDITDGATAQDDQAQQADGYDPVLDAPAPSAVQDSGSNPYEVIKVTYDENLKTGKKSNKGSVFVMIPSVDSNGDIHNEIKTVPFYLDGGRNPIIENDYMPVAMYNAIKDAVASSPDTEGIDTSSVDGGMSTSNPDDVATADAGTDDAGGQPQDAQPEDGAIAAADDIDDLFAEKPEGPSDIPSDITENPDGEGGQAPADAQDGVMSDDDFDGLFAPDDEGGDDDNADLETRMSDDMEPLSKGGDEGQESPAETRRTDQGAHYPIVLGLATEDIKPIKSGSFKKYLDDSGIKYKEGQNEGDSMYPTMDIYLTCKADACALKDYFADMKNYDDKQFANFFPELKGVLGTPSTIPVAAANESADEGGVKAVKVGDKYVLKDKDGKPVGTGKYDDILGFKGGFALVAVEGKYGDKDGLVWNYVDSEGKLLSKEWFKEAHSFSGPTAIVVTKDGIRKNISKDGKLSDDESRYKAEGADDIAKKLKKFAKKPYVVFAASAQSEFPMGKYKVICSFADKAEARKCKADSAAEYKSAKRADKVFLADASKIKAVGESMSEIEVPYNGFLISKVRASGFDVREGGDTMDIVVSDSGRGKLVKIFESFYTQGQPTTVRKFIKDVLDEEVKITVKDTETGKGAEIDLDTLDVTTFDKDDSDLYGKDDGGDGKDEDKKDDGKQDEGGDDGKDEDKGKEPNEDQNEGKVENEPAQDNGSEQAEKPARKFKFHVKKRAHADESAGAAPGAGRLNESAQPQVMDYVRFAGGKTGQIICKMADGDFIISAEGRTFQCQPSSVTMLHDRPDTVEAPFKYDKETLKGLFEQMVPAGVFMNGARLTPNDCYVKYSEFVDAKQDDDVRLVVEGQQTFTGKKYVKVLADINEFANVNDYAYGHVLNEYGVPSGDILMNMRDYAAGAGDSAPVRSLVLNEDKKYVLTMIPKGSLEPSK